MGLAASTGQRPPWADVKALFEELLPATPERRSQRLAQADAELATEARELLAQHEAEERAGSVFLARPATLAHTRSMLASDQRLGPWRLGLHLGSGGMGEVWEAHRADGTYDARVAIKVLRLGIDSSAVLERFALEQRTLARLDHANIARLLDAGRTSDGAPYFVLEVVSGQPIDQACKGLDLHQRLSLFLQLADAVAFAHRHLLVHRDLKPGNVMVTHDGAVKLLDFGIAQALVGDEQTKVAEGQPFGAATVLVGLTPAFASPEQVRGEPVGTATDVYALGLLLHLMLTGTRAYGRDVATASQALRAVLEEDPVAPSRAPQSTATHADPGVPRKHLAGDIDAIVGKALAKASGARYASVDAMAADLRAVMRGQPVAARAPTLAYVAGKFMRRNRAVVAMAGLALAVLVLGLGASVWRGGGAITALALLALGAGTGVAAWQARAAATSRDAARSRLADTRLIARDIVMRYADNITYLPGGLQMKAQLLGDTIAHLQRLANVSDEADSDSALQGDLAMAHSRLADIQVVDMNATLSQPEQCAQHCERALALFPHGEAAHRSDPQFYLWWGRAMHTQAVIRRAANDAHGTLLWRQRMRDLMALASSRFVDSRDLRHELASAHFGLGSAYDTWMVANLNNPVEAGKAFDAAAALYQALDAVPQGDAVARAQLGVIEGARMLVLSKQGLSEKAAAHGRLALQFKRGALLLDASNVAYREGLAGECNNLTNVLLDAGLNEEALTVATLGADTMRALERDDPDVPTWGQRRRFFALHLGRALLAMGDAQAALSPLQETLAEMQGATQGQLLRRRALAALVLARALWATERPDAAASSAQRALLDVRQFLSSAPADVEGLCLLAEVLVFSVHCDMTSVGLTDNAARPEARLAQALNCYEQAAKLAPLKSLQQKAWQQLRAQAPVPSVARGT